MKGTLNWEKSLKDKIDMLAVNVSTSLERKLNLLEDDWDKLYTKHYDFKATNKNPKSLIDTIQKCKLDLAKYEEILKRYMKYNDIEGE